MTDFLYKGEVLYVDFEDTSLKYILNLFSYPVLMDARLNGSVNYDFSKELLLVNTKLNHAKFLSKERIDDIYDKSGIDLSYEVFDKSSIAFKYQNDIVLGDIKLANDKGHIFLTNAKINTKDDTVDAYFDVDLQKRAFSGKVYGTLDHTKVNLDFQKLIKYEMNKQMDGIMGQGNREMMDSIPMVNPAKDVASGVGAGFVGMFF